MLSMKRGRESSALLALCVLVLPLTAQDPVGFPESPLLAPPIGESPFNQVGRWGQQQQSYDPFNLQSTFIGNQLPLDPEQLSSTWMHPEAFQGFPVFPTSLGGYGSYPPPPEGFLQPPLASMVPPPARIPAAPDWPGWVVSKRHEELPYGANNAVVVRQSDRVWVRDATDAAFTPLYHWDITRSVSAGSRVRVPQTGEFLAMFYGGTRLESFGSSELHIKTMVESGVELELSGFTHVVLTAHEHSFDLALPDGSRLRSLPVPEDAFAVGMTRLCIDRVDEPRWFAGRATVFNGGSRNVALTTALGDVLLEAGRRVTLFLTPPTQPLSHELVSENVQPEPDGPDGIGRRFTAQRDAAVVWSGARFALPAGATLQLDPMMGRAFSSRAVSVPEVSPRTGRSR